MLDIGWAEEVLLRSPSKKRHAAYLEGVCSYTASSYQLLQGLPQQQSHLAWHNAHSSLHLVPEADIKVIFLWGSQ